MFIYAQSSSISCDHKLPISNEPSSIQLIITQLKENIIQGWLLYVIRTFFKVGFRFQYQLINLDWLSFEFFSFNWSLIISFLVDLYSWMRNCPKIEQNILYSHFSTHFAIKISFICTTWKRKQTMEQQLLRTFEWTKSKQKQDQVTSHSNLALVPLFDVATNNATIYQKSRFLDNDILMFVSAWCLIMV